MAFGVDHRNALQRQHYSARANGHVHLACDGAPNLLVFFNRGAHKRNGWVVLVQVARLVMLGDSIPRAEIHHVVSAYGHHSGNTVKGSSTAAIRASVKNAASNFIAPFGGSQIEYAFDEAAVDQ